MSLDKCEFGQRTYIRLCERVDLLKLLKVSTSWSVRFSLFNSASWSASHLCTEFLSLSALTELHSRWSGVQFKAACDECHAIPMPYSSRLLKYLILADFRRYFPFWPNCPSCCQEVTTCFKALPNVAVLCQGDSFLVYLSIPFQSRCLQQTFLYLLPFNLQSFSPSLLSLSYFLLFQGYSHGFLNPVFL